MSWRPAKSLDILLDEINRAAPNRSKASDGSIGDLAHSSRYSDHNPNSSGVVRARDFTHDPSGGLDCNILAEYLASILGKHPATGSGAYIIWDERIISTDRLSEGWRYYGGWMQGRNPHDKHLHQSVATYASGYDSTQPWGWTTHEEDPMPTAEEIANAVWSRQMNAAGDDAASFLRKGGRSLDAVQRQSEDIAEAVAVELAKVKTITRADVRQAVTTVLKRVSDGQ